MGSMTDGGHQLILPSHHTTGPRRKRPLQAFHTGAPRVLANIHRTRPLPHTPSLPRKPRTLCAMLTTYAPAKSWGTTVDDDGDCGTRSGICWCTTNHHLAQAAPYARHSLPVRRGILGRGGLRLAQAGRYAPPYAPAESRACSPITALATVVAFARLMPRPETVGGQRVAPSQSMRRAHYPAVESGGAHRVVLSHRLHPVRGCRLLCGS